MRCSKSDRKPFTFNKLVNYFRSVIKEFPDKRIGDNTRYSIEDATVTPSSVIGFHPSQS